MKLLSLMPLSLLKVSALVLDAGNPVCPKTSMPHSASPEHPSLNSCHILLSSFLNTMSNTMHSMRCAHYCEKGGPRSAG
ncbi:hypothetical protein EDD16DRAFT_1635414 [Pisolithus croceorrhizus]|nr:hypothetical protein EDD16DRAFT_1635414 [Pisolithus croceorrhizus]KAI6167722.1 hypothetical protein EDD17DRAFT_1534431 [Pisolithus thermaeus]